MESVVGMKEAVAMKIHDEPITSSLQLNDPVSRTFDLLQKLLRDKTRFEPEDVKLNGEYLSEQAFTLKVQHTLISDVVINEINGYFKPSTDDIECDSPDSMTKTQIQERLKLASDKLDVCLKSKDIKYNSISPGIYLKRKSVNWHLHTCKGCSGRGRVSCHTCHGKKHETCFNCSGNGNVTCNGCFGSGRKTCNTCHGTGQISEVLTFYANVWDYTRKQYVQERQSRTEYRSCPAYGCYSGRVGCNQCFQSGKVTCGTCSGSGVITCRTCTGIGNLKCNSCEGSGKLGNAAWVDVSVQRNYTLLLPENAGNDAKNICALELAIGIPSIASKMSQTEIKYEGQPPYKFEEIYEGQFKISRLEANCNDSDYHIVAYGEDYRWLTLDNIVQNLLQQDLDYLSEMLILPKNQPMLLYALKKVIDSELNAEIIEDALRNSGAGIHLKIVSEEYAANVKKIALASLDRIYIPIANRYGFGSFIAIPIALVTWQISSEVSTGFIVGLFVIWVSAKFLFARSIRKTLMDVFGGELQVTRTINLVKVGNGSYLKRVWMPAIVGLISTMYYLHGGGYFPL